jgi:type I restriction enzyme R subunit
MIAPGRIMGKGRRATSLACDYVLVYRNTKLASIEAKAATKSYTDGVGQAKDYATRLLTRFAYATNGRDIYRIDMDTGAEGAGRALPLAAGVVGRHLRQRQRLARPLCRSAL